MHLCGFNLERMMRHLTGFGSPRNHRPCFVTQIDLLLLRA